MDLSKIMNVVANDIFSPLPMPPKEIFRHADFVLRRELMESSSNTWGMVAVCKPGAEAVNRSVAIMWGTWGSENSLVAMLLHLWFPNLIFLGGGEKNTKLRKRFSKGWNNDLEQILEGRPFTGNPITPKWWSLWSHEWKLGTHRKILPGTVAGRGKSPMTTRTKDDLPFHAVGSTHSEVTGLHKGQRQIIPSYLKLSTLM